MKITGKYLVMLLCVGLLPFRLQANEEKEREKMLDQLLALFMEEFIEIKPGDKNHPAKFSMGADTGKEHEQPAHEVTMKHEFAIAKYEVPQNLYEAVMGNNPSKWKGPRNSVEMMTWSDAVEFCSKITQQLRKRKLLTDQEEIRLPTEAEWEYACRAGTSTPYSFGESATKDGDEGKIASLLNEYGWHTGNAAGNDPPVGALQPNPWGLYDVHGYLWEFVSDDWHDNYKGAPIDGSGWNEEESKGMRVIRGGSWKDRYDLLTSYSRAPISIKDQDDAVGFRCVKATINRAR